MAWQFPPRLSRRRDLVLPGQPKPAAIFGRESRNSSPGLLWAADDSNTSLTRRTAAAAADFSSLRMAVSAAEVAATRSSNGWKAHSPASEIGAASVNEGAAHHLAMRAER